MGVSSYFIFEAWRCNFWWAGEAETWQSLLSEWPLSNRGERAAGPIRLESGGQCPKLPPTPGQETHSSVNPSGVSAVGGEVGVSK